MESEKLQIGILFFTTLVPALCVHEVAHGLVAFWLGDDTAKRHGRLTLNPMAHLDRLGTLMLVFMSFSHYGFGWAKPVPVNPLAFKNPRRGYGLVAAAGPISNILQAILAQWCFYLIPQSESFVSYIVHAWLYVFVTVNCSLAAFNLLPFYPLDGQKVLSAILPQNIARQIDFHSIRLGAWPLLIIVVWEWVLPFHGPLTWLFGPVAGALSNFVQKSAFWLT